MTDQLPRAIPTDPAEQLEQMPEWAFQAAWKRNWPHTSLPPRDKWQSYISTFPRALALWEWMPEPVDPDLQMAREVCAACCPEVFAGEYLRGDHDDSQKIRACLAMAKRVREAKQ